MPLNRRLRYAVYAAFAVLFLTGVAWLAAGPLKDAPDGETWQAVAADLLMVHGGVAMLALMLLGALIPLHLQASWRRGRNRSTGIAMAAFNAVLIVTAFGLYYLGSEISRFWFSWIHIGVGTMLPALIVLHIALGRRGRAQRP